MRERLKAMDLVENMLCVLCGEHALLAQKFEGHFVASHLVDATVHFAVRALAQEFVDFVSTSGDREAWI